MLANATRSYLDLDRLINEIQCLFAPPGGGLLGPEPQNSVRVEQVDSKQVKELRKGLAKVLTELDERLIKALESNRFSMFARYAFVVALAVLFLVAAAYAFVDRSVLIGLTGAVPAATATWVMRNLRSLQDERVWLIMRVKKYEPRLSVCLTVACLQQLAHEIEVELDTLNSPVTAERHLADQAS